MVRESCGKVYKTLLTESGTAPAALSAEPQQAGIPRRRRRRRLGCVRLDSAPTGIRVVLAVSRDGTGPMGGRVYF